MSPLLPISKNDTHILKGIGIILIMFHNFFRWVEPRTLENEFNFSISCVKDLFKGIINTPYEIINLLFSFFGFYGIVLFFFISAYGLTISYRKQENVSYLSFIKIRILKLYPVFIGAIVGLILWSLSTGVDVSTDFFKSILYKLLLISNFIADEALSVNGPWWFFVCIMQFYLIFPLLMKGQTKFGNKFLLWVAISGFAVRMAHYYIGGKLLLFVPYSFIPYLFELSLGIYLATVKEINISKILLGLIAVIALLVFVAGNFFQGFWYFSAFAILVVFLYNYPSIRTMIQNNPLINKFIFYIGSISLYLFLMHGFLREPLVYYAQNSSFIEKIGYALLFFALSLIFAHLLQWAESKVLNERKNRNNAERRYFSDTNATFFSTLSKLVLIISMMVVLLMCFDLLFAINILPHIPLYNSYLINHIKVFTFVFPVLCLLALCMLFCFRKFTVWIVLALFLAVTLVSNIEVLKLFREYHASGLMKSVFLLSPILVVILAGILWKRCQNFKIRINRLSIIIAAVLLGLSLVVTIFLAPANAEKQCYRFFQLSKAERIYDYLIPNSETKKEVVFILTDHEGMFDPAMNPENETESVVAVSPDRLYQNIFSDNSMPEHTQYIEVIVEFQYYPFSFKEEHYLNMACDINQSFLKYHKIYSSIMKKNRWNNYQTYFFISRNDGFTTQPENCLILYFYNNRETKFYLRNCKVTVIYYLNNPVFSPKKFLNFCS
jgi:peptidoglycan/LPS O-acetylase OafA/YrhL